VKTPWSREGDLARLTFGGLSAQLDLAQPWEGLHEISLEKRRLPQLRVLQVQTRAPTALRETPPEQLADVYIRGQDLVATYVETAQRPVRPQLYWRALRELQASEGFPALELIISTQTQLLDSDPTLIVASEFPAGEILQLADAETGRFQLLDCQAAPVLTPAQSAGLVIARPAAAPFSLMLCSFPTDFEHAELTPASTGSCRLAYRLFSRFLEKGVILRGRLRIAFVPRECDQQAALACYQDFLKSPLPLTT
jgi:hypothetical protein